MPFAMHFASFVWVVAVALALFTACGDDDAPRTDGGAEDGSTHDGGGDGGDGVCNDIHCGDFGACRIAGGEPVCACMRGYTAVDLGCVYAGEDLCADAPCSAGCSLTSEGDPRCVCAEGERNAGLRCVNQDALPCAGSACSGHGVCEVATGTCNCDTGYTPTSDGLGCTRVTPTEVCVPGQSDDCVEGRSYQTCCTGSNCNYQFDSGLVFRGLSSAAGYCLGEDLTETDDGNCAGKPDPCDNIADETACLEVPGCEYVASCFGNEVARRCESSRTPTSCGATPGCHWVDTSRLDDDWTCESTSGRCAPGRAYQMCCDFGCEARFEDGTVARGPESILGYCFGETESVVDDGTCFSDCSLVKDQATCESIGDYCHWAGDMCRGGDLGCFASYTQTSCDARDACYWTTPDITFAPKDFHPGDQFDPENVNLPTLSSPPIALGTPCPRTCENGCVGGGGAIAINESGLPKPLVNMDYCVPFDTPVLAMTDGEVVRAEKLDGDFNYALILRSSENQNFVVIYDHLGALTVSEGDTVSAGDRVGTAVHGRGDIYDSAGFEVHVNQLRGSDDFGEISPCPMHFATAEVRADAATRLLVNHVHDPYYRGSAWMLCERPFVTSY